MEPKITPRTTDKLLAQGGLPSNIFVTHIPEMKIRDPLLPEKVAIIGTAQSSRSLAPFGDPSWTIWGSSPGNMGQLPRIDAWIEVHANFFWPELEVYGRPYVKWLNEQTFPVLTPSLPPYRQMFPRALDFPWRTLVKRFGDYFFTSTFAWMMAYAIHVGVKEMGLYGVDMSSENEYIQQRPGGHYFIQRAREAGIKVVVPPESDLLQPSPLYGIADSTRFGRKAAARQREIDVRIAEATNRLNQAQAEINYLKGAREDVSYHRNIWGGIDIPGEHHDGHEHHHGTHGSGKPDHDG